MKEGNDTHPKTIRCNFRREVVVVEGFKKKTKASLIAARRHSLWQLGNARQHLRIVIRFGKCVIVEGAAEALGRVDGLEKRIATLQRAFPHASL